MRRNETHLVVPPVEARVRRRGPGVERARMPPIPSRAAARREFGQGLELKQHLLVLEPRLRLVVVRRGGAEEQQRAQPAGHPPLARLVVREEHGAAHGAEETEPRPFTSLLPQLPREHRR